MDFIVFILVLIMLRILTLASIKGVYNVLQNKVVNRKLQVIIILIIYILSVKIIVDKSFDIYELSRLISEFFNNIQTGVNVSIANNSLGVIDTIACINENSLSNTILLRETMNKENIRLIQNVIVVETGEPLFLTWNYPAILAIVVMIDLVIAGIYKIIKR